jgi:predicted RNA binding protein YcfA (HicA-like mRNA interferase family)
LAPRTIRQLKADLRRAGFVFRPGKGSHTVWSHPLLRADEITLAGGDGDDAKPYQEQNVRTNLAKLEDIKRRQT